MGEGREKGRKGGKGEWEKGGMGERETKRDGEKGIRFHLPVSDKIRWHLEIHSYGSIQDLLVLYFPAV